MRGVAPSSPAARAGARRAEAVPERQGSGSTLRAFAGVLAAVACSSVFVTKKPKKISLVTRYWFPSACSAPRQMVLRRLSPFGEIPAWSRKGLRRVRIVDTWRARPKGKLSLYGRCLMEKQRVRFHYNIKETQMCKYVRKAFSLVRKKDKHMVDQLMQILESRLDNFLWRTGLAPTMPAARFIVTRGHIETKTKLHGWKPVNIPSILLKPGDQVRVRHQAGGKNNPSVKKVKNNWINGEYREPPVPIPSNIEFDPETLKGTYLDICDINEIGINVDDRYIFRWYSKPGGWKRRAVRSQHFRTEENSNWVIKKRRDGGKPRATPENILNFYQAKGLRKKGRSRPPCLWGTKLPKYNVAYTL